jgi:iron complex transport system permease protein
MNAGTRSTASKWGGLALLLLFVFLSFCTHIVGPGGGWGVGPVLSALFRPSDDTVSTIVWALRLPRACACLAAGCTLGIVGAAFQALFRNPLAEPYIVGVSSGAAVGGSIAIVTGFGASWTGFASGLGPMMLGFPCGLATLLLVFAIATRRGIVQIQTLLLAGVVVGALLSSVLSLILLAGGEDTNRVLSWLLGSMTPMSWNRVAVMAGATVLGSILLFVRAKQLNAFAVSEETAQRLGVDTRALKPLVLVTGTAMVAVIVGAVGIIGFLGLVAPHLSRRLLGVDWRWSMVGAGLLGASILCLADLAAQRAIPNTEVPVGIVTAIVGAPFLLGLMRRD